MTTRVRSDIAALWKVLRRAERAWAQFIQDHISALALLGGFALGMSVGDLLVTPLALAGVFAALLAWLSPERDRAAIATFLAIGLIAALGVLAGTDPAPSSLAPYFPEPSEGAGPYVRQMVYAGTLYAGLAVGVVVDGVRAFRRLCAVLGAKQGRP